MSTYMDIEEIRVKYWNGDYKCSPNDIPAKKVKENHIFDENLSVKRNREMVAEHNKKVEDMTEKFLIKNIALSNKLRKDVTTYISNVYNMTEHQAYTIEAYVYTNKHSFMNEYFDTIDEVA